MAWKRTLGDIDPPKETEVANPEKKIDEKPAEKSIADQIAEALKPVTEGFTAMRTEIDGLKVRTAPKPESHEIPSVMDDEDGAFNTRLTPIMQKTLELEARQAKDDVEKEYTKLGFGDLWEDNRKDIDKFLSEAALVTTGADGKPIVLRGSPEFIRNVADMMIGRAAKKGGIKFDGKDKKFFLEDTTGDGTIITRREKETDGITKKQLDAAKRFGIPVADYRKAMSKLDFVDRN